MSSASHRESPPLPAGSFWALTLLVLLTASVYLYTSVGRAITDDGDALYAHVGQNMARNGDWVTPYANGVRFLDKPPMMYWVMALSYRAFGFNEFAARLPSALAVLGITLLLFSLGTRSGGISSGVAAGLAGAFCAGTFLFTMLAFPDVYFVFFLTLSLFAFLKWYESGLSPLSWALLFFASLAGAVLSKGMMGLVFPVAIAGIFLFCAGDWRRVARFHLGKGSLLFLILALPWHILAAQRNPGFLWYFFVNEQILRFVGKRQPLDYESISLPLFWGLVLVWSFPWSGFLPAVWHAAGEWNRQALRSRPAFWLCLIWVAAMLVFFSLSSRIEHYAMPVLPPLALLAGVALSSESLGGPSAELHRKRSIGRSFAFLGILGCLLAVTLFAFLEWADKLPQNPAAGDGVAGRLHAYRYFFAPLFELPPGILDMLKAPMMGTGIALGAGMPAAWLICRGGRRTLAVGLLSLVMAGFCLFACQGIGICEEVLSSRQFGMWLLQTHRPTDRIVVRGDYETANSLNFYLNAPLYIYEGTAALLQWGLRYPDAPKIILSKPELEACWRSSQRVFLLAPDGGEKSLGFEPAYPVMRSGGRTLLCNRPPGQND
jgi:4-amino-4-deoxy-L-arabinose transferase-like glycosyltransferase